MTDTVAIPREFLQAEIAVHRSAAEMHLAQVAKLERILAASAAEERPGVPLKVAADRMRIEEDALLKRLRRQAIEGKIGAKLDGRWYLREDYVRPREARTGQNRTEICPDVSRLQAPRRRP